MKRINNLYQKICSLENLHLADAIAQQGKGKQYGVQRHNRNAEANINKLHEMLINKTFKTSPYKTFPIFEPKEREIFQLPYYPDRIVHHAIMNILEPIFVSTFTADTYSCVKGRGVHKAAKAIRKALRKPDETSYCLKLDITKFYPSVNHDVLKQLVRGKIKCADTLWLLDGIIDSAPGLPIGNYLSQYLSNFYLTGFDHWLKENKRVTYYFRYADDMAIIAANKPYLHALLAEIKQYLHDKLSLQVKGNYQVFPVDIRGIDMLGYRFFRKHTLMRKSIKKRFARAVASNKGAASIASYKGWAKHCNSKNLIQKLLPNEQL
jgi:RNA-directed DNA polymerase